jgi:glycosyltransferase involved in cell wall biosynthesis
MRILFLTSRMPYPPVGGDRFRVYHVMRAAAEAGHAVHLLSFDLGREERNGSLDEIARSVETVPLPRVLSWLRAAKALPGRFPLQAAYYRSRRMRERVEHAMHRVRPHVVVTHLFRMAPYALAHVGGGRARSILDLTDVISAGIERAIPFRHGLDRKLYEIEGPRIRSYESEIAPRFDECWVISPAEAAELARIAPKARVRVVPNGMSPSRLRASTRREPASLLFLGNLEVFHNRDAARFLAREVFPRVRSAIPESTLAIAGKGSDLVRSWAERIPGVRVLGYVDDADEVMARASVFVAPHRFAAGVQNKVLQALSCATPVVTTSIVRNGLEPVPDGVIRVADDPDSLAAHVIALLRDPDGAAAVGHLGRAWVQSRFTWEPSVLALEAGHAVHSSRDAEKPFAAALRR